MVALSVFIMATLRIVFEKKKKKLLDEKGPFGGNVFEHQARCSKYRF